MTLPLLLEVDKGSGVVVWDREDYSTKAEKQLGDKETYKELSTHPVGPLSNVKAVSYESRIEVIYLMELWNTFL